MPQFSRGFLTGAVAGALLAAAGTAAAQIMVSPARTGAQGLAAGQTVTVICVDANNRSIPGKGPTLTLVNFPQPGYVEGRVSCS